MRAVPFLRTGHPWSGYMIHSILDGKGIYLARGRKLELSAGDAFLIVPGEPVYYEADETEPWTYAWMGFHGAKIENYIERTSLLDTLVCSYGDDERFFLRSSPREDVRCQQSRTQ